MKLWQVLILGLVSGVLMLLFLFWLVATLFQPRM